MTRSHLAARWIALVVGVVALVHTIYVYQYARGTLYDFNLHYFAAIAERTGSYTDLAHIQQLAIEHGVTVPREGVYGTPALIVWLYMPLSYLSFDRAATLWSVISVLVLSAGFSTVAKSRITWPWWMVGALFGTALLLSLSIGNVSTLTLVLLMAAYGALRDDRPVTAGLFLGIAIALKGYPAFLLLALIYKRRRQEIAVSLGTVAVMFSVTLLVLGPHDFITGVNATLKVGGYVHPYHDNVSIPGLLLGSVTESQTLAKAISYALMALAAGALYLLRRTATSLLFALAASMMLLTQSITWVHYSPLTVMLGVAVWEITRSRSTRVIAVFSLVLSNGVWAFLLFGGMTPNSRTLQMAGTLLLVVSAIREIASNSSTTQTDI